MFKDYKKLYLDELFAKDAYRTSEMCFKQLYYKSQAQIDCYKKQIDIYEKYYKKMGISSNIGFGCGIASLAIIIIRLILRGVIK